MRVLVTGATGFVGGHLCRALVARGHFVCGIDNRPPPVGQSRGVGWEFHPVDVLDRRGLEELFKTRAFHAIAHLAAGVGPEHVVTDPYSTVAVNVEGTQNVLDLGRRYYPNAFVLYTSTSEVYGNCPDRPFREDSSPLVLGPSQERRWCYAASKLSAEHLVLARGGLVVRLFNTTGPGQSEAYVLPRFVGMALRGEDITLYGDGSQVRCFCHVEDTVRALVELLELGRGVGEVVNIGADRETSILELAERVRALVNTDISLVLQDDPPPGSLTMPYRRPDLAKVKGLIGWMPYLGLDTIIKDVVTWKLQGGTIRVHSRTY